MSKTKVLILVATLAAIALLILPTVSLAQPAVCRFYGSVTLDGANVADGTVVKAWIGSTEVGSGTTTSSNYIVVINGQGHSYDAQAVSFTVTPAGGVDNAASQQATFTAGASTALNLTALTEAVGTAGITLAQGTIAVSGSGMTPNSVIKLTWDGKDVTTIPATVKADVHGAFTAMVVAPVSAAGNYVIKATDAASRSAEVTLNAPNGIGAGTGVKGDKGDTGATGPKGDTGPAGAPGADGEKGKDASSALGIVALILAIIAICVAAFVMLKAKAKSPAAPPPPPPAAK
jgi:hypothetical protein